MAGRKSWDNLAPLPVAAARTRHSCRHPPTRTPTHRYQGLGAAVGALLWARSRMSATTSQRLPTGGPGRDTGPPGPSGGRIKTGASERLPTGSSTTTSSSRPNTNASRPNTNTMRSFLPPIAEALGLRSNSSPYGTTSGYPHQAPAEEARPKGVRKTLSDTTRRLGFYSAPGEPKLLGSYGYTSPAYTELLPANPGSRTTLRPAGGPNAVAAVAAHAARVGPGPKQLLSEKEIAWLKSRDADNQQVFDLWAQRKVRNPRACGRMVWWADVATRSQGVDLHSQPRIPSQGALNDQSTHVCLFIFLLQALEQQAEREEVERCGRDIRLGSCLRSRHT